LSEQLQGIVNTGEKMKRTRAQIFEQIEDAAWAAGGGATIKRPLRSGLAILPASAAIPHIDEPWYCCAEPTGDQLASIAGTRVRTGDADAFV
jgi:hypothetical protein